MSIRQDVEKGVYTVVVEFKKETFIDTVTKL